MVKKINLESETSLIKCDPLNKLRVLLEEELFKVRQAALTTLYISMSIAIWRFFDTKTFIFIQIILCSFLFLIIKYAKRLFRFKVNKDTGNELLSVAIAFILITSTLINIDRSRSVFVLKWVNQYGQSGTSIEELQKSKNFSSSEKSAVEQRIREQEQMKLLNSKNGKVYISELGKIAIFLFERIAALENLQGYKDA